MSIWFSIICIVLYQILFVTCSTWYNWTNPCNNKNVESLPFCNQSLSFEQRAYDLVYIQEAKLTENGLQAYQTLSGTTMPQGVPTMHIPPYNWNTNAPHGACSAPGCNWMGPIKNATMFPQVIATAKTFNTTLFYEIGKVISTELRAMHNNNQAGLTVWSPNINIFRDPRWGRGQETPGEDPFLTSEYAVNFVHGMEGDHATNKYLKTSACCKHFVDYSLENSDGKNRHNFNAIVNDFDQNDTYLVGFKYCVTEGNVSGLMCSYNAVNGIPSCADKNYLTDYIRDDWGFYGYIVSDCDAVTDVINGHHYTNTSGETINVTFSAGMDIDCGMGASYSQGHLESAVKSGAVNISVIQRAIYRSTLVQMRLGMFDDKSSVPWSNLGPNDVATNASLQLSYEASQQGIVLLKNNNNTLPILDHKKLSIALIGPNAQSTSCMVGNDNGKAPIIYTVELGLELYVNKTNILYEKGCQMDSNSTQGFSAAVNAAKKADLTILVMGLDSSQESENNDRKSINLPGAQNKLIQQVSSASNKTVLVVISGGCVDISESKVSDNIDAILYAGYPGMYGGRAIADVIFGAFNPSGRLVQTFYYSNYTEQIMMDNMNMRENKTTNTAVGRGYRYFYGDVVYPFGFGGSFTTFKCSNFGVNKNEFSITVNNDGEYDGGAVVLVYFVPTNGGLNGVELKRLVGFGRINMLKIGKSATIKMQIFQEFYQSKEHSEFKGKYVVDGACSRQIIS